MNRNENRKKLVLEALAEYEKQNKARQKKKVFHNTELLLKNYNKLKLHCDNAVYEMEDAKVNDLYIDSILKSKIRTSIMVIHTELALELLKKCCTEVGESELVKYRLALNFYLDGEKLEDLAVKNFCSVDTARRWKADIIRDLSVILFGEGGLILSVQ